MIETQVANAERTIRSMNNILYRYRGDYGYKYIHELSQFITTLNSRENCYTDLISKNIKNPDILSVQYRKTLRVYPKLKFRIVARACISKYDLPFRKGYKLQFTREVFGNCCNFFQKT